MAEIAHEATLDLLGRWRLTVRDEVIEMPVRSQRVLAAIALQSSRSRSQLAEILWPDGTHDQACANLRVSVWEVRRRLPYLVSSGQDRLEIGAGVAVDVLGLRQRSAELDRCMSLPELWRSLERLQHAELLPGWDEPWLQFEQERVRAWRLRALESAARAFLALDEPDGAEEAAATAISIDPWRETAYALLMRAHAMAGNRAVALVLYDQVRRRLERELRVEPVPALSDLAAALRRGGQVARDC